TRLRARAKPRSIGSSAIGSVCRRSRSSRPEGLRDMTPGETVSLTIEKPAAGGRMIARADGQGGLVSGALPGERVDARVERVSKSVAYAETIRVIERSPDRRDAATDPLCGGALYRHIAYARQLTIKRDVIVDAFARIGHLDLPPDLAVAA